MLIDTVQTFFLKLKDLFMNYEWISDTLDILLVALIAYGIIVQLRKSQSIQILRGLLLVVIVYGVVTIVGMKTSSYIFTKLFSDIIVIFAVLFSTEIRQVLENIGKNKWRQTFFNFSSNGGDNNVTAINAVCRACGAMSASKVGSLIIFQRKSLLGDLQNQAVRIDSETTYEMVCSVFYPKAPLHDGAIIIKDGRIVAARCVVPMKNDRVIDDHVGTRHRAAIEVSLNSDAVAVVTSEETGIISLAVDGQLRRGLSDSELREQLGMLLLASENERNDKATGLKAVLGEFKRLGTKQSDNAASCEEENDE